MERNIAIDVIKGVCILLVVLGHYNPANAPENYHTFVDFIYTFHMPVFLWASGFLYIYIFRPTTYVDFIRKKARRLLLPYFAVSVIIISLKLFSQNDLTVDHPVDTSSFLQMLYSPAAGYFLWYVWALFLIFLIVPLFTTPKARLGLLLVSFAISIMPISWPKIFALNNAIRFLPYFALGMCCADVTNNGNFVSKVNQTTLLAVSVIAVCLLIVLFLLRPLHEIVAEPLMALLGLIAVTSIAVVASRNRRHIAWIIPIADSTFIIYLFHTTFQGLTKASLEKLLPEASFVVDAIFIFSIGVFGPMALHHLILKRNRITRYIFSLKSQVATPIADSTLQDFTQTNQ